MPNDKFGQYPTFMLMRPHCFATFTDPRFSSVYFAQRRELESVRENVMDSIREVMEIRNGIASTLPLCLFKQAIQSQSQIRSGTCLMSKSIDAIGKELTNWSGISAPSRDSNPVHTMAWLKRDFPLVNSLSQIFNIPCNTKRPSGENDRAAKSSHKDNNYRKKVIFNYLNWNK